MTLIPGLPRDLRQVPPSATNPDDHAHQLACKVAWLDWRQAVIRYRLERRIWLDGNPSHIQRELSIVSQSFPYFVSMYCFLFEPRDGDGAGEMDDGELTYWIPFDRQIEIAEIFEEALGNAGAKANIALSKSREMGASWLCCAWVLWKFLFAPRFTCLLLSRNEDFVDSDDPKSLFWKIMQLFDNLPSWMKPAGWNRRVHRNKMRLKHPTKKNYIVGESTTTNSGRGNRVTVAIIDEAAFVENLETVWAGLVNTTRHVYAVSSESIDTTEVFYKLRSGQTNPAPIIIEWDWWQCPYHDQAWLIDIKERFALEPFRFNQEVLRDPKAGNQTYIYPGCDDKKPDFEFFFVRGGGPLYAAMDPGQRDNFAIVWGQDKHVNGKLVILDSYETNKVSARFIASVIMGVKFNIPGFVYGPEEERIMEFVRELGVIPTFFGDVYGENSMGASADSVYDILQEYGIYVNVDRTPTGEITAYKRTHRSRSGRREAMRELIPRLEFADSPGAIHVLSCIRNHKYKPLDDKATVLSDEPIKDWTSHVVAATEYLAVNVRGMSIFQEAAAMRSARVDGSVAHGLTYLT